MTVWYEIWDEESANLVEEYDSQEAALDFMRQAISELGVEGAVAFELLKETSDGPEELVARGRELVLLATVNTSPETTASISIRSA